MIGTIPIEHKGCIIMTEENFGLRKKVEKEVAEEDSNVKEMVEILIESFLKSDSNYGIITDIKTDINRIYSLVTNHINLEKLDIYALKLEDRILLSRTNLDFDEIYEVVKGKSQLQARKNMIEIWDDAKNSILHLFVAPLRKHFPLEYSTEKEKAKIIKKLSSTS